MPNAIILSSTCKKPNTEIFLISNHWQGSWRLKIRKVLKITFFNFCKFFRSFTKLPSGGTMLFSNQLFCFRWTWWCVFPSETLSFDLGFVLLPWDAFLSHIKVVLYVLLDIRKNPICLLNTTLCLYNTDKLCWCPTFETSFQEAR